MSSMSEGPGDVRLLSTPLFLDIQRQLLLQLCFELFSEEERFEDFHFGTIRAELLDEVERWSRVP